MNTAVIAKSVTATAIEVAQAALKVAQAAHAATLPVASAEQVAELCTIGAKLEITEADTLRVKEIKEGTRLRDEEKDQLNAAKAQRVAEASKPEERRKFADAIMSGFVMDARRKLRVDGRVISTVKVLV